MSSPCKGNFDRLLALMDGKLRPGKAEQLRKHMEGCPGCADAFRRMQSTQGLLREAGTGPLPELNWREVETKLHWRMAREAQEKSAAPARAFRPAFGLSLAGAALLGALVTAAVLFNLDLLGGSTGPGVQVTPTPPGAVARGKASVPSPDPGADLSALATLAQGEVYLLTSSGSRSRLELNRPLFPGDRAITYKGRLAMQWGRATGMRMVPDTEVELKQLTRKDQELVLWQGKVFVEVEKRAPGQQLAVLSQGIRAQVKGTHLAVERTADHVVVEVYRGSVEVISEDGRWDAVQVPAGFAVSAPLSGKARPQMDRIPVKDSVTAQDSVSLMNLVEQWNDLKQVLGATGTMRVSTKPDGADLRLNSRPVGITNLRLRSTFRNHLLEVYRGGKLVEKRWVDFKPDLKMVSLRGKIARHIPKLRTNKIPELSATFTRNMRRQTNTQIQRCYERRLKQNPNLEGVLEIVVSVEGDGKVIGTRLGSRGNIRDSYLERCAMARAQAWRFAPAKDGKAFDVALSFKLSPR